MASSAKRLPFISRLGAALALLLISGAVAGSVSAQESDPGFTRVWRGEPLDGVLEALSSSVGFPLSFDPLLVDGKRVFCVVENASVIEALDCILLGTGLDFIIRSTGTFVIVPVTEGAPLYGNLRGLVLDQETEQPISNAHVLLAAGTRLEHGRTANDNGVFLFSDLLPGSYRMTVSHLGYRRSSSIIRVQAGSDERTVVTLAYYAVPVAPIVIDGIGMEPSSTLLGSSVASQTDFTDNLEAGTAGLLSGIDAMPGVRVNDATADVHIQGGEAGEHQFRLDGAPVFIPLNVARIIGPFSPFSLGKITVNKAGFGASIGSQISGVIDAEHDLSIPAPSGSDGPRNRLVFQLDPMSANARFNAHVSRPNGTHATYMSAARVGLWDVAPPRSLQNLLEDWNTIDTFLLSAFAERNTPFANLPPRGRPSIGFFDWHNAAKIRLTGLRTLYASSYWGSSSLGNDLAFEEAGTGGEPNRTMADISELNDIYRWQNGAAQVTYESVLNSTTLAGLQARGSLYRLRHEFMAPDEFSVETAEDDGNRVYEIAMGGDLDYMPRTGTHSAEFGAALALTSSRFHVAGTQLLPLRHESTDWRLETFGTDRIQIGRNAVLELGARLTYLHARSALYGEPRLSVRFDWQNTALGGVSLYVGSGVYRQYVNQYDISSRSPRTFVSSTRFWMGTDGSVAPPKAGHVAAELLVVPSDVWSIRLESHYKRLYHALSVDYSTPAADSGENMDQDEFLKHTDGFAYGYAIVGTRSLGPGRLRMRFDFTESRRRISDLFRDEELTVPWNEPFRFEVGLDLVPMRHGVLLARWQSTWGRTWGYRQAYYDFLGAHLNDLDVLLEDMRANGVSSDAVRRVERQVEFYDLLHPERHELAAVHQLDLSFAYTIPMNRIAVQVRADVVNVLNTRNTAEWRFELDEASYFGAGGSATSGLLDRDDRPLLPRVFMLAGRITW